MRFKETPMGKQKYAGKCHGCGAEAENMGNQGESQFKKRHSDCNGEAETWKMEVPEIFTYYYLVKQDERKIDRFKHWSKATDSFKWTGKVPLAMYDEYRKELFLLQLRNRKGRQEIAEAFDIDLEEDVENIEYTTLEEIKMRQRNKEKIELPNNTQGRLAEAIFKEEKLTEEKFPKLYEFIHKYLRKLFPEKYEESSDIILEILQDPEEETEYFGEQVEINTTAGWTPDFIITASLRDKPEFNELDTAIFPVEVKSGRSSSLERNQRNDMIEYSHNNEGIAILASIDLEYVPENYLVQYKVPMERKTTTNFDKAFEHFEGEPE